MKKYTNASPVFSERIDIYERTDPVDADTVDNVPLRQLQDNALALKAMIEEGGSSSIATAEEVQEVVDTIRRECEEEQGDIQDGIATDEEVDDVIANLDDL